MSDEPSIKVSPFLSHKEARAITLLSEQACQDEACGDAGCTNIRRTVGAVKRLLAKLMVVRAALDAASEVKA